jgi:hypothetical protein
LTGAAVFNGVCKVAIDPMDAETREELRMIHKRISGLEEDQECSMEPLRDTLEQIKTVIQGRLDGSGEGFGERLRKLETSFHNHVSEHPAPSVEAKASTPAPVAPRPALNIEGWKLPLMYGAIIVVGVTCGWKGLTVLFQLISK